MDDDFDFQPVKPRGFHDGGAAAFAEMQTLHDSLDHDKIDKIMMDNAAMLEKSSMAQQVLLDSKAPILADQPEHHKAIEQAIARDAANGIPVDTNLDPHFATRQMLDSSNPANLVRMPEDFSSGAGAVYSGGSSSASGSASSAGNAGAEKPSDLESTIAAIRLDSERQKRFVILGDQDIKNAFMRKLEARGQVYYSGGASVITISRAKALATLKEVTEERDSSVVHAVNLKLDREGGGPMVRPTGWDALKVMGDNIRGGIDSIKAGFKNVIGRQHEIDVVVVGNKASVDAKLEELGKFISDLDDKKLLKNGQASAAATTTATSKAAEGGAKESSPATDGASKVVGEGAESGARRVSLKDLGNGKPLELVGTSTLSDVLSRVQDKVNAYSAELAAQREALKEHEQAKKIKSMESDKAKESGAVTADKPEPVNKFASKLATQLTEGFQDTSTLAQEHGKGADKKTQAETLLQKVSALKDPVEREFQTLPEKDRHQALVHIAALVQKADSKEFGDKAVEKLDTRDADKSATPRENLDKFIDLEAKRTPDLMAKITPLVQELVSSKAITETQSTAITEQFQKASEKVVQATPAEKPIDPASAYVTSPAIPTPHAASQPLESTGSDPTLRNSLAQVAASGPDKLSAEQAQSLVSSLEALRGKSLAALDDSKGDSPTQTLVRVEGLLQMLGKGELGDDLKAKAKELAEPLRQWKQQDALRYVAADGSVTNPRPEVVAQTKAAESEWHPAPVKEFVRFEDPVQPAKPSATTTSDSNQPAASSDATAAPQATAPLASTSASAATGPDASAAQAQGARQEAGLSPEPASNTVTAPSPAKDTVTPPQTAEAGTGSAPTGVTPQAPEASASKSLSLRDSLEQLATAGPDKLSASQAENLVASLDALRTKPLAALDASEGARPTQTLVRVEGLLKELESGRLGDELKAQAKDLEAPLQKWAQQDAQRYARTEGDTVGSRDAVVAQAKASEQAWHSQSTVADTKPELGNGAPGSEPAIGRGAVTPSAQDLAAQRLVETEAAGGKLSMMMSNPPGSFTNRDKSWNETNIQKAAQEVLKLDPESVDKLSTSQVTKLAAYSYWLADKASSGRLPGFDTPEGKEQASQLVSRAGELLAVMDAKGAVADWPKDVAKDLKKADNMVEAREKLDQMSAVNSKSQGELFTEASTSTAKGRAISPAAARSLANELIDSVYRAPEITETQAKYLLKNAANLTPESLKSLDSQTQAKTAVALSELTEQVRNGAMGEVSQLPGAVQKHLVQAEGAVEKLLGEFNKSSGMRQSLQVARSVLDDKLDSPAAESIRGVKDASRGQAAGADSGPSLSR